MRTPEQFRCNSYGRGNQVPMHAAGKKTISRSITKSSCRLGHTRWSGRGSANWWLLTGGRVGMHNVAGLLVEDMKETIQWGFTTCGKCNWTSTCHNLCHLSEVSQTHTLESCDNIIKIRAPCNKNDSPNSGVSCSWSAAQRLHFYHRGMN